MKVMNWNLEKNPPTFDILGAFIIGRTLGVEHVTFRMGNGLHALKYSPDETWRRLQTMAIPLAKLCGLSWDMKEGGEVSPWRGTYGQIEAIYKHRGQIFKLTAPKTPFNGYVTLTLRNVGYQEHRNTGPQWQQVKDYLESIGKRVFVMPDDITVSERLRIYLGAEMNLGVTTGPMALCHFSDAPYLTFRMLTEGDERMKWFFEKTNFVKGSQFSFRNSKQQLVWEPDDFDTVIRHYSAMNMAKAA